MTSETSVSEVTIEWSQENHESRQEPMQLPIRFDRPQLLWPGYYLMRLQDRQRKNPAKEALLRFARREGM